jgi:hypothetical protein
MSGRPIMAFVDQGRSGAYQPVNYDYIMLFSSILLRLELLLDQ